MKINYKPLLLGITFLAILQSCQQNKSNKAPLDGFTSGTIKISADESFAPILDEELYVFKASFPESNPVLDYKPEAEVVNDLLNDKIRAVILSRNLDTAELGVLKRRTLTADVNKFAIDAVAIIVNEASADTTISLKQIKSTLLGQLNTDKNIVFDNPNSSLVRYLKTITGSKEFKQKNIYALNSSKEVIKYVSTHPNSIGITGFAWLNDPDKDYADAVSKVKIVGVKDENSKIAPNEYFKPSQNTLVQHLYPLSRSLYIIDCTGRKGLAAGFASFLASERGQRIILKSGLLPDSIPSREINLIH
ncbi:PstS family phosphate ABC transporter substrate-binding protein [Mucilaginibacter phyllosphaerae]|uniref:Phosphate ABC transporter substrate-binding protein n=1 Tax=Mucilaginibacter phyllosphaerae TaxID=1812349 RepID=A0A4Y8AF88_9SPHI|nr:substrate-binding domain-containing protein [Mucilaginibacter phyllosphaerae]MBB3970320.1 phosphate transport system substrate-binding protein [Mucilaginibacter phyllosphaerae]TEW66691.1 phosphate ABC transporter substrate-binding protein [Mucilaginibacter phyllosphaerae]GGH11278.1 phosphate ABC transporter substrate-binding protein [Mucilaginibacter phyllosphaerae]